MPSYTQQVIRTTVFTDANGLPREWEMELDLPQDDPWSHGFGAWGRNRSFTPKWISVARHSPLPPALRPATIAIEVRSKTRGDSAPIVLHLPWTYAAELARLIVKAARSLDHAALDAIAELLDGREWSGADDLSAIASLIRSTGREVRDAADASGGTASNDRDTVR